MCSDVERGEDGSRDIGVATRRRGGMERHGLLEAWWRCSERGGMEGYFQRSSRELYLMNKRKTIDELLDTDFDLPVTCPCGAVGYS